jgi:hypothetical protein
LEEEQCRASCWGDTEMGLACNYPAAGLRLIRIQLLGVRMGGAMTSPLFSKLGQTNPSWTEMIRSWGKICILPAIYAVGR